MRAGAAIIVALLVIACSAPVAPAPTPTLTVAVAPTPVPPPPTPTARAIVLEPRLATGEYFRGRSDAPVSFDMYGDFQCPACGEFARTIEPTFIQTYVDPGKVRLVWRDYAWIRAAS